MKHINIISIILLFTVVSVFAKEKEIKVEVMKDVDAGPDVFVKKIMIHGDLELTPEQEKKFEKIKLDFEQEMLPWKQKIETKELEFKKELLKETPNKQTLFTIVDETGQYYAELLKKEIERNYTLRSELTREQKEKWDKGQGKLSLNFGGHSPHMTHKEMIWIGDKGEFDLGNIDHEVMMHGDVDEKVMIHGDKKIKIKTEKK